MVSAKYTGMLKRDETGAIVGELRDEWGWTIALTATPADGGGYALVGVLGEPPEHARIEGIDGPQRTPPA